MRGAVRFGGMALLAWATHLAAVSEPSSDAGPPGPPAIEPRWSAGAAAVYARSPYRGQQGRFWAFPAIQYMGPRFFVLGPGLGVRAAQTGPLRLDVLARVRFSPFNEKDGGQLQGIRSRSTTVEAGPRISAFLPFGFRAEGTVLADVLDRHRGVESGLGLARGFRLGDWRLIPSARVEYWSHGLAKHYYGVSESEAAPGRPPYRPGSAWTPSVDLMVMRSLGGDWNAMLGVGASRLGASVVASPIVEQRMTWRSIGAVTYTF